MQPTCRAARRRNSHHASAQCSREAGRKMRRRLRRAAGDGRGAVHCHEERQRRSFCKEYTALRLRSMKRPSEGGRVACMVSTAPGAGCTLKKLEPKSIMMTKCSFGIMVVGSTGRFCLLLPPWVKVGRSRGTETIPYKGSREEPLMYLL